MELNTALFTSEILRDRYPIQSLLGRKTGRRFRARDVQTDLLIVVKRLLFGPDFTWDEFKRFKREANPLGMTDNPITH